MNLYLFLAPTPFQIIVVLVLGVLFFGKKLPDVARQVGLALMELKKGMNELSDLSKDVTKVSHRSQASAAQSTELAEETERYESVGTKFEPPVNVE